MFIIHLIHQRICHLSIMVYVILTTKYFCRSHWFLQLHQPSNIHWGLRWGGVVSCVAVQKRSRSFDWKFSVHKDIGWRWLYSHHSVLSIATCRTASLIKLLFTIDLELIWLHQHNLTETSNLSRLSMAIKDDWWLDDRSYGDFFLASPQIPFFGWFSYVLCISVCLTLFSPSK